MKNTWKAVMLAAALACGLRAESGASPQFEVASVKRNMATAGSYLRYQPGGRVSAMVWVQELVWMAYGLESFQVIGGPDWVLHDRYDIEAKAADPNAGKPELRAMLQTLLADRFKLKFHREDREFPVYSLLVNKDGPKLSKLGPNGESACRRDNSEVCGMTTTAHLCDFIGNATGRPVIDKTGIQGKYDILLSFDVYSIRNRTPPEGYDKPDLHTALSQQLGMRIEPGKATFPIIVIDSVQRPGEN